MCDRGPLPAIGLMIHQVMVTRCGNGDELLRPGCGAGAVSGRKRDEIVQAGRYWHGGRLSADPPADRCIESG